jgi:hypothetical protein
VSGSLSLLRGHLLNPHRGLVWVLLTLVAVAIVATVMLIPYGDEIQPPLSYDTPYYVWRTRAVAEGGLDALTRIPAGAVTNPHRPGFPILGSILGTITGTDALTFSLIVRAVAAVAMGLTAGAMARESLREPPWASPAFVIGLGLSAAVLGTAVENLEQLLVDIFLVPLAVTVPLVASGRRGAAASTVFLAAAAATHWVFTGLFLSLLLATGVILALLPRHGEPRPWSASPSARVLKLVGLLTIVGVAVFVFLPAPPSRLPPMLGSRGNMTRLGAYEVPEVYAIACLGLFLGLRRFDEGRRATVVLLVLWAATLPVAIAVSSILPHQLKLFRIAPFALGAPILATVALIEIVRLGSDRLGRIGVVGASLVLGVGLFFLSGSPTATFEELSGAFISGRVEQGRVAGHYLAAVSKPGRPVIFTTQAAPRLVDRAVRSGVPSWLIEDTWVFVGTPDDLAARQPVDDPLRRHLSRISRRWWATAWSRPASIFERDPIVIALGRPGGAQPPGTSYLAPGVSVIRGPAPPVMEPPAPFRFSWAGLITATALCLLALAAVGAGWARALLDVSSSSALALAPALGAATLILGGLVAGRVGLPIAGPWAIGIATVLALLGWIVFGFRRSILPRHGAPTGAA